MPIFVDSAMTGPDRTSTNAAGMSVISGASAARKASRSSTTMKSRENCCVWFCDEPEALMVSSWIASCPVRWTWRSLLSDAAGKRGSDGIDRALRLGASAEGDHVELDQRLPRLAIARDAKVDELLDLVEAPDLAPRADRSRRCPPRSIRHREPPPASPPRTSRPGRAPPWPPPACSGSPPAGSRWSCPARRRRATAGTERPGP